MKASKLIFATQREDPSDAEIVSHKLMIRAGLIRQVSSGIYNWLPTGKKVLHKVENIIREEMNSAGAQEILMPMVQPVSLWEESGRIEQYGMKAGTWGLHSAFGPNKWQMTADQTIEWYTHNSTSYDVNLAAATPTADRTITLPDETGTVVLAETELVIEPSLLLEAAPPAFQHQAT